MSEKEKRPGAARPWVLLILPPFLLAALSIGYGVFLVFKAHGDRSVLSTELPATIVNVVYVNHAILLLLLLWFLRLDGLTFGDIGWRAKKGILPEVMAGLVGGVAIYLIHQYVTTPFASEFFAGKDLRLASGATPLGTNLAASIAAGVIGGGFVEESLYRGYVLKRFGERMPMVIAVPIMLFFFACLHFGLGLSGMAVVTITGFLLTMLYLWRGSLIAPAIAHALINVLVLVL